MIGLVPQELTTDAFETGWATVSFSRGLFAKRANPDHIEKDREGNSRICPWGTEGQQDHHAFGRQASLAYRQGTVARAADPVSRRADRWRRGRGETRNVGAGRSLRASGVTIILTTHYIDE